MIHNLHGLILWSNGEWAVILLGEQIPTAWLHYKHPDGQWVSKRELTQKEVNNLREGQHYPKTDGIYERLAAICTGASTC